MRLPVACAPLGRARGACIDTVWLHCVAATNNKQVPEQPFYSFSSLVNYKNTPVLSFLVGQGFIGRLHEHGFVTGTANPAASNACVNTRDGSQVAAMSDATGDGVFNAREPAHDCVLDSFTSQSNVFLFSDMVFTGLKLRAVRTRARGATV